MKRLKEKRRQREEEKERCESGKGWEEGPGRCDDDWVSSFIYLFSHEWRPPRVKNRERGLSEESLYRLVSRSRL